MFSEYRANFKKFSGQHCLKSPATFDSPGIQDPLPLAFSQQMGESMSLSLPGLAPTHASPAPDKNRPCDP
jgi:hypothetical protein